MKKAVVYRKLRKLLNEPELFVRDLLIKRRPPVYNEIKCEASAEQVLVRHDSSLEGLLANDRIIDVVFTWVDGSDPAWAQKRNIAMEQLSNLPEAQDARSIARFRNHDELTYSVYGVLTHLPWVRTVYIVTDGQRPQWQHVNKKIRFISHDEIIPSQYLPTFNSHVIEAHLHKISGLSENFIYFNDDVFVARYLEKNHFFSSNGLASLFPSEKRLSMLVRRGVTTATLRASLNCAELLARNYGVSIDVPLVHTYVPLRKSTFQLAWNLFEPDIEAFLPNKFRNNIDLNIATFLVPWLMYLEAEAFLRHDVCHYFNIASPSAPWFYENLIAAKESSCAPHSFCVNDVSANNDLLDYGGLFSAFIRKYYGVS